AVIAGLSLLPPTILMGATLPAVARWVKATPGGVGWLGRPYTSNIAGVILGCLLSGFYLLRQFDVSVVTVVAVLANLTVSAIAFAMAARTQHRPSSVQEPRLAALERATHAIYFAIAMSGL